MQQQDREQNGLGLQFVESRQNIEILAAIQKTTVLPSRLTVRMFIERLQSSQVYVHSGLVPGWEQPGAGPLVLPVRSQQLQHPGGQGHQAVLPPVALVHPHQHPLGIDVGNLQLGPFSQAPPTGVDQLQTHPGVAGFDQDQQGPDFLRA
jgi:hypothetical protein